MKKESLILSTSEFDFVNPEGQRVKGASLFIVSDKLTHEGQRGYRVAKLSTTLENSKKLLSVPCLAEIEYDTVVDKEGKFDLKISNVKFLKDYPLGI